ncbi:hypothetical protein [Arthrobacter sp. ZGTC212]|uniref:hypothetical protein n=1 Tax=Arthrobacter sp. ZGTC212 TaxID=2058899 RepID=UPI000CE33554|nr:hypothetical protein [Arthrobacter sp. ZGTC212]
MEYPDTNLSVELKSDLAAWEADYYAGSASEKSERPAGHTARGRELAERLSAELGWRFSVSVDSGDQGEQVLIRSSRPAANPKAEQAFAARFYEAAAEAKRLGHEDLVAYAPNSKQVFAGRGRKKGR